ncbi:hypothetical protein [uncultured Flavobacterium sp.]|uniref:hypothetical protein n=1 Tax=uncultured Flavobacterium sp. TaxID=165435 RepID=UPI0025FAC4C9|nr:hypothetical protein [uncultured Flavobacterium sp.]
MKKIFAVKDVIISIGKSNPPTLIINAEGDVPTTGWKGGILSPYIYAKQPEDGIYEFDFIAQEPGGIVNEVITPISASYSDEAFDPEIKGVKIYASNNFIKAFLENRRTNDFISEEHGQLTQKPAESIQKLLQTSDRFNITNVYIWENVLHITVVYGGGCREHGFELVWDGTVMESMPSQVKFYIIHNANQDPCKAIVEQELQFVLPDEIMGHTINLDGWDARIQF